KHNLRELSQVLSGLISSIISLRQSWIELAALIGLVEIGSALSAFPANHLSLCPLQRKKCTTKRRRLEVHIFIAISLRQFSDSAAGCVSPPLFVVCTFRLVSQCPPHSVPTLALGPGTATSIFPLTPPFSFHGPVE